MNINIKKWLDDLRPLYSHHKEELIDYNNFYDKIIRGFFKDIPDNEKDFKNWVKRGMLRNGI